MMLTRIGSFVNRTGIYLVLAVLLITLGAMNPSFRSPANLLNILQQSAVLGVVAIGMTFAIVSGAFDLSVGSIMALTACVLVSLVDRAGFYPALILALGLGSLCGLANGLLITGLGISPFIATLGTLWVFRAFAFIYTGNAPLQSSDPSFVAWDESFLGLSKLFLVMAALYLAGHVLMRHTPFGRSLFAVGSNPRAALVSGVNVVRVRLMVFVLTGFFAAFGGAMLAVRMWSAKADTAMGYELMVIATVVLGGTSLKGGRGTLLGTLGAALLFTTVYNALDMFHVQSYWQKIALGGILILALSLDGPRRHFASRNS